MAIILQNLSTVCSDAEVRLWAEACNIQIARDCAPAWGIPPVPVRFFSGKGMLPGDAWPIYVLDDSDQQDALGWHQWDGRGNPYGRVFARTCIRARIVVSTVVSHEVIEAAVDPYVNRYSGGWICEVCDPTESDSYPINLSLPTNAMEDDELTASTVAAMSGPVVEVSDFTLPSWYVNGSKGPWDFLRLTTGPFTLRPGGYAVTPNGTVYAEHYEETRKWMKITDGSRTLRAIAAAAPRSEPLRAELVALDRAS